MIRIEFDFKERDAADLHQLNKLLATMELEELRLKDTRGYLATTTDSRGALIHLRYGFDRGTLVCTPAEAGRGEVYQIESVVVDRAAGIDDDEYLDCWRQGHPDRVMRQAMCIGFDQADAYVIVHHRRKVS